MPLSTIERQEFVDRGCVFSVESQDVESACVVPHESGHRIYAELSGPTGGEITCAESASLSEWPDRSVPAFESGGPVPDALYGSPGALYHQRLWYLWYAVRGRDGTSAIWGATSSHGRRWLGHSYALEPDPVIDGDELLDPAVVRDGREHRWLMAYTARKGGACNLWLAESHDLQRWERLGPIMEPWLPLVTECRHPRLVRVGAEWLLLFSVLLDGAHAIFATSCPDLVWWPTPVQVTLDKPQGGGEEQRAPWPLPQGETLYLYYGARSAGRWELRLAVAPGLLSAVS